MTHPLYLIEANYGRLGRSFRETDRDSNSRASVIELIRSGEVDPVKVLEIDEDAGTCRDVTAEILADAEGEIEVLPFDHQAARFDHARALRNEVV